MSYSSTSFPHFFIRDRIFGHEDSSADDIIYINWLNMVRAGLLALEFFSPDSRTWGQVSISFFKIDSLK